ncbi:hypothetical protein [Nocardia sp. NPDC059239]|uniref:hypothetical protein n=1 Tax=unclassified Nocardia TaxID=2637762 RepID=UPI0036B9B86A
MTTQRTMLLATYNINKNASEDDYDKFLREVDMPFYNSIESVVRYSNWKVVDQKLGEVGFRYIDLIVVDGDDPFELFKKNSDVQEFIKMWESKWAEFGTDEKYRGKNYQIVQLDEIAAPD